jgi:hypothetical protein
LKPEIGLVRNEKTNAFTEIGVGLWMELLGIAMGNEIWNSPRKVDSESSLANG